MFTGGCNLSCPYCHNPGLVLNPQGFPDIPLDGLVEELRRRRRFIDGVVISGGEPTLEPGLAAFLQRLRQLGLQIKLDSNGLQPLVIERLLAEGLIDYLALDVKTAPERYPELGGNFSAAADLQASLRLARKACIEVEFRTTCVPLLVGEEEIDLIGELLRGAPLWVLQQYVPEHAMLPEWRNQAPYRREALEGLAQRAARFVSRVQLRGI